MGQGLAGKLIKAVTFASTTSFSIGNLPANALITDIYVLVGTAFNAGGNDFIDVGDSTTAAKFADNINVASVGRKVPSGLTNVGAVLAAGAPTEIKGIYVPSATSPSAGSGYVVVEYVQL